MSVRVPFNDNSSILDVKKAIDKAKPGQTNGIPSEVLRNDTTVLFLHALYNICFDNGVVPSIWSKCIINPIVIYS